MSADIAVLVPAHNESVLIGETVKAALAIQGVTRVLVVDDGSDDGTDEAARSAGATVVRLDSNVGKGAALEAGADLLGDFSVVLLLDADLGATASQAAALIGPVLGKSADMSIATFPKPAVKAGFGLVKGLARWGIRTLAHSRFEPTAPLSGQRAMSRECLSVVRPFAKGYGVEVALTVRALRAGLHLVEVPTQMSHAHTGRDAAGFAHRGRQFAHVAAALVALAFERVPRA